MMPNPVLVRRSGGVWTPAKLAGLVLWLRADRSVFQDSAFTTPAVANADPVGGWQDQSGQGNHLTQATNGNRPKLRTGGVPAVASDYSATQYLNYPAGFTVDRQAVSVFTVVRRANLHTACALWNFGSVGAGFLLDFDSVPSTPRVFHVERDLTTLLPWSNPLLYGVVGSAGGLTGYVGALTQTAGALTAGTAAGGRLMARADGLPLFGDVYEQIVVNRAVTATEVARIQAYVVARYGPATHAQQVLCEGDSLTDGGFVTLGRSWPVLLSSLIGPTWRVYNQGTSGAKVSDMNSQEAAQITGLYAAGMTKNLAILFGGTNDIAVEGATDATTFGRIQTWLSTAKTAGFSTGVCTIPARGDAAWTGTMETYRLSVNTSIRGLDSTYADFIVDLAGDTRFQTPTDTTYYYSDKIHLVDGGATAVASLVAPYVLAA